MSYDPVYGNDNENKRDVYVESTVSDTSSPYSHGGFAGAQQSTNSQQSTGAQQSTYTQGAGAQTGPSQQSAYSQGAATQQSTYTQGATAQQRTYTQQTSYNPNFTMYDNQYQQPVKKQKKHPFLRSIGKAAAIAVVFGLVAGVTFQGTELVSGRLIGKNQTSQVSDSKKEEKSSSKANTQNTDGTLGSTATTVSKTVTDVSEIVDNVMPSIVQVTNMSVVEYYNFFGQAIQYPAKSAGSGVIIDQDDDYIYIATNNHVVAKSNSLTVTFNNDKAVPAEIQGTQASSDLAVVKVAVSDLDDETISSIKMATIGDSDSLKVGSPAIVIGNALGYGQSTTQGIISALDREVTIQNEDDGTTYTNKLIQTDAAVNPGNSGGALLNMNGELVGIVSAKYSDEAVEGMGYAIPISQAEGIISQLMSKGKADEGDGTAKGGAYLGIAGVDVDSATAAANGVPAGVYVSLVKEGSAAEKAGLRKGNIITAFEGNAVASFEQLSSLIAAKSPGDEVTITVASVQNDYEPQEITVTLGTRPTEKQ